MFDILEGITWLVAHVGEQLLATVLLYQTVLEFRARRRGWWRDGWVSPAQVWREVSSRK